MTAALLSTTLLGKFKAAQEYAVSLVFAVALTFPLFAVFQAQGPYAHYGFPASPAQAESLHVLANVKARGGLHDGPGLHGRVHRLPFLPHHPGTAGRDGVWPFPVIRWLAVTSGRADRALDAHDGLALCHRFGGWRRGDGPERIGGEGIFPPLEAKWAHGRAASRPGAPPPPTPCGAGRSRPAPRGDSRRCTHSVTFAPFCGGARFWSSYRGAGWLRSGRGPGPPAALPWAGCPWGFHGFQPVPQIDRPLRVRLERQVDPPALPAEA